MRALFVSMVVLGCGCRAAAAADVRAEVPHDTRLEQAVKERVAGRMGEIRQGFAAAETPAFITPDMRVPVLGTAPAAEKVPAAATRAGTWSIATADDRAFETTRSGSFQTFSDGTTISADERRQLSRKTVSRIINF